MNKNLLLITICTILLASLAYATPSATISFSAPTLKENAQGTMSVIITANESFNGTLTFTTIDGRATGNSITGEFLTGTQTNSTTISTLAGTGAYTLNAMLTDISANTVGQASSVGQITDGIAPQITVGPSGNIAAGNVVIYANANEDATCRYSGSDNTYALMSNTFAKNGTTHLATLSLGEGAQTFYVRCIDAVGNEMQASSVIQFSTASDTYADIVLSKESPLTAGIVEVRVITSKNLNAITLSYYFSDAPTTTYSIPLAGAGNSWSGYMIVPETTATRIGTFVLSGIDTNGNPIGRINSGKLFILDTSDPKDLVDIGAIGETYRIRLKWFYKGDTGKFNIYRAENSDVSYVDLYAYTNESYYLDKSVTPGKTYYYRVAAVTASGNVGPLSSVVSAEAFGNQNIVEPQENTDYNKPYNKPQDTQQPDERVNSNETKKKLDAKIKEFTSLLIDIDKAKENIASEEDTIEKNAIERLGLTDIITAQREEMLAHKTELENYRTSYISDGDLTKTLEMMDFKVRLAKAQIPKSVVVTDKSSYVEARQGEDILAALNAVKNESEVKASLDANKKANEGVKVEVNYAVAEIKYLDDSVSSKTIIEKAASHEKVDSLGKTVLVETIPKSLALSTDDISFKTKFVKVVRKDPVISLEVEDLSYDPIKLVYVLEGKKDLDEVKKSRLIAVIEKKPSSSALTGFAILTAGSGSAFDYAIIAGVILLIVLIGYYFMFVREQPLAIDTKEMHGPLPGSEMRYYSNTMAADAAQAYGNYPQNQNSAPSKVNYKPMNLKKLVNEGHYHIDNMNYDSARAAYEKVISMYDGGVALAPQERNEIDVSLNALYAKLALVGKINEAHRHIERNDKNSAMIAADAVARLYAEVARRGENTALTTYASQWNNYIQSRTNR